jgi:ribose 5-phosphate isomerase A
MEAASAADRAKRAAADAALQRVEGGMTLGLGTGSTAAWMVRLLADRVREGLEVRGVPTSEETRRLAERLGVPLTTLDEAGRLDLTVDGADEIDPGLNLLKGGGGALLREKIVAAASASMLVIADSGKRVATLGRFPLPVEIVCFGWRATRRLVADALGLDERTHRVRRRMGEDGPYVTDQGNYILDLDLGRIDDPPGLDCRLNRLPGVVETGLFTGMAGTVILGHEDGRVEVLGA